MTDISFITDTISIYRKNRYLKRRYDTDNIGIADIIDDIDTIDPSLAETRSEKNIPVYVLVYWVLYIEDWSQNYDPGKTHAILHVTSFSADYNNTHKSSIKLWN